MLMTRFLFYDHDATQSECAHRLHCMQIWNADNFSYLIINLVPAQKMELVPHSECIPGAPSLRAINLTMGLEKQLR